MSVPSTTSARAPRTAAALAVLTATALLLGGCAGGANAQEGTPGPATVQEGGTVRFGTPFIYDDGLFVEVRDPRTFTPSEAAEVGAVEGVPVRIRVKITNGTRQPFIPHTLEASVVSGGQPAVQIEDPEIQMGLTGPGIELRSAGTASFELGFVVADPDDVTLTIVPDIGGYEPLVVTG